MQAVVDQRGQPRDLRHQVGTVEGRRGLQAAVDGSPLPLPQGLLEEPAGGCRLDQARHAQAPGHTPQQVKREIRRCVHCGAAQTAPLGWPAHAARWVPVADPEAVGGTPIGVPVPLWWVRPLSTWPLGTASRARIPA